MATVIRNNTHLFLMPNENIPVWKQRQHIYNQRNVYDAVQKCDTECWCHRSQLQNWGHFINCTVSTMPICLNARNPPASLNVIRPRYAMQTHFINFSTNYWNCQRNSSIKLTVMKTLSHTSFTEHTRANAHRRTLCSSSASLPFSHRNNSFFAASSLWQKSTMLIIQRI